MNVKIRSFQFDNDWQMLTLGDEEGNPYQFALTAGTHTIRLEVTLGELGDILTDLNDSVFRLNAMYRKILVLEQVQNLMSSEITRLIRYILK